MKITKIFTFEAAHHLPNYEGICANIHGHHYVLEVTIDGPVDYPKGMVMDFGELKDIVNEYVIDELDHTDLNTVLDNPTAECLVQWIEDKLKKPLQNGANKLYSIRLWETPTSYATWGT